MSTGRQLKNRPAQPFDCWLHAISNSKLKSSWHKPDKIFNLILIVKICVFN